MKRKHFNVILFSSFMVVMVMLSVLIGYNVYLQWKENVGEARYQNFTYKVTAEIFRGNIDIHSATVRSGEKNREFGVPEGMPMLDGKIKNNSGKTVTSMMLEVAFSRPDGTVIYRDWFYPLDQDFLNRSPLFSGRKTTGATLASGEYFSFRHVLGNCPTEIVKQIDTKGVFAKTERDEDVQFNLSVRELSVL